MQRPNLTRPFWIALSTLLLFIAGLFTSVILVEECHTEQECDFEDPDTVQCPEGLECCENGICCQIADPELINADPLDPLTPPPLRSCDVGETITAECVCRDPNHDRKGICTGPDPIPLACQSSIVQTTLKRLKEACDEHGSIEACPPEKIRAFAIDNKKTLLELARSQAPHSVTLHFRMGTPGPGSGPRWARPRQDELLASLRQHLDLSQPKGFILMIVLTSDTGEGDNINLPIARERSTAISTLLAILREAADHPLQNVKVLEGLVTTEMAISPQEFRATWGADPGRGFPERFIGPSTDVETMMRAHLARHGKDSRWLKYMLNQSVVLIPIPCNIDSLPSAAPAV